MRLAAMAAAMLFLALPARAQLAEAAPPAADPLAPFERLIGGRWHLEGSYQELTWGVGRRSVVARGYFLVDGEPQLVADGFWYWHPGEQAIRGVFVAVDMPVVLFDYTTRFEGDAMVSDLRGYAADGSRTDYVETWEIVDEAHVVWTLERRTPDGLVKEFGGTYTRR